MSPGTLARQGRAEEVCERYPRRLSGWRRSAIPVLVTDGGRDVLTSAENARVLGRLIRDTRVVIFENAGLGMWFQDQDRFVPLVVGFGRGKGAQRG